MSRRGSKIWIPRALIESQALINLKSKKAVRVYLCFLTKAKMSRIKRNGRDHWVISNNGEIVFTYKEAKTRFSLTPKRFRNIIDELIAHGLIEITESGNYYGRIASLYKISERWRDFGKPGYSFNARVKDTRLGAHFRTPEPPIKKIKRVRGIVLDISKAKAQRSQKSKGTKANENQQKNPKRVRAN